MPDGYHLIFGLFGDKASARRGGTLYRRKTVIQNKSTTPVGGTALTEIEAALDKTPSTKMLGGLLPIPFKMWMYNDFVKYKRIWKVDVQPFGC